MQPRVCTAQATAQTVARVGTNNVTVREVEWVSLTFHLVLTNKMAVSLGHTGGKNRQTGLLLLGFLMYVKKKT